MKKGRTLLLRYFAVLAFVTILISNPAALSPMEADGKKKSVELSATEKGILDLTNETRKEKELSLLEPDPVLFAVARAHSANMAKQQKLDHILDGKSPFQRIKATGYRYFVAGENIAKSEGKVTLPQVFESWMDSKSHRENILESRYTKIGLAAVTDDKGQTWYTQVFAHPRPKP